MKTHTILAGIAALFLATGAAHAINWHVWKCPGGRTITQEASKDENGKVIETITVEGLRGNWKGPRVKFTNDIPTRVYLDGKRCQACFYGDCSEEGLKMKTGK